MREMFERKRFRRNPMDIELVSEISLKDISDWLLSLYEGLPEDLLSQLRNLETLRAGLSPIYKEMQKGDSIWRCRTQKTGPLYGNEGIALVRKNRPRIYIAFIHY